MGLFAAAKTPGPIVERLYGECRRIGTSADVTQRLEKLGAESFLMAPAAFDRFIVQETAKAEKIVRDADIKI